MKSSTFSLFAIGFVLAAYGGMAVLENTRTETEEEISHRHSKTADNYCGNANWTMIEEGEKLVIRCIRRKPLNSSKVKP